MISAAALYPRIPPTSIVPKCTTLCSLSHSPSRISVRSQTLQSSASTRSLFRRRCFEKNRADELFDRFSALPSDIPWHDGDIWSIFAAYFILHIPLSFGGLSVVAEILHEPDLDPLIMVVSLIALQTAEYVGVSALLYYNAKPQSRLCRFFHGKLLVEGRSWITASAAGIGSLVGLMLLTSIVADLLVGPKGILDVFMPLIVKSREMCEPRPPRRTPTIIPCGSSSSLIAKNMQPFKKLYASKDSKEMQEGESTSFPTAMEDLSRPCSSTSEVEPHNGENFLRILPGYEKNLSEWNDLVDFIECKPGKDYSTWLKNRKRFRVWQQGKRES